MTPRTLRTAHSSYVDLDPAEYEYVDSFDLNPEPGAFHSFADKTPFTLYGVTVDAFTYVHAEYLALRQLLTTSATSAWNPSHETDGWGRCDHCGAHLRYVAVFKHLPTYSYVATGETCAEERFGHDSKLSKDVDRLRKRAAAERALAKVRGDVDRWLDENPDNRFAVEYAEAHRSENYFFDDLLRKLKTYGPWSDRQRDAVLRSVVEDAARAKRKAEEATLPTAPVPEGRYVVTGVVLGTKWKENAYGGRLVFTVRDDRGFKVWGTVPSGLYNVERDDRVQFTGTVTPSPDDETFGFFKRPTKAEFLDTEQEVAA